MFFQDPPDSVDYLILGNRPAVPFKDRGIHGQPCLLPDYLRQLPGIVHLDVDSPTGTGQDLRYKLGREWEDQMHLEEIDADPLGL